MNNPYGSPNPPPWGTGYQQGGPVTSGSGQPIYPPGRAGSGPGGMPPAAPDPYSWGSRSDQNAYGPLQPGAGAVGGFPDPLANQKGKRARSRRIWPWLLGFAGAIAAGVVAFLGFVAPGWFYRPVLDANALKIGVGQILRDSYGLDGVESIDCPREQAVEPGTRFRCGVVMDGERMRVQVTVRDELGTYEVGRPN